MGTKFFGADRRTDGQKCRFQQSLIAILQMRLNISNKSLYVPYSCIEISYLNTINQQMHFHKYVNSHIIIRHQPVSLTPATVIRVFPQGTLQKNRTDSHEQAIRNFPNAPTNRLGNTDPTLKFLYVYFYFELSLFNSYCYGHRSHTAWQVLLASYTMNLAVYSR